MMLIAVLVLALVCILQKVVIAFHSFDVGFDDSGIIFKNASLGLDYNYAELGHQCDSKGHYRGSKMEDKATLTYTPNRRNQHSSIAAAVEQQLRLAVVLAVGGHSDSHYNYGPAGSINGLMAVWDSWLDNFFSVTSNTTSLVLLFDERDFRRQNNTRSKPEYLDSILVRNMGARAVPCIQMHATEDYELTKTSYNNRKGGKHACSNELHLDQGYRVYYIPTNSSSHVKPLVIFASVHSFPIPFWLGNKDEEDELFRTWKPWRLNRRYPTNYGYVKMTNWYSYYMLKLQLLDFFDYGGKLDNDVSFVSPFPEPNLPHRMANHEAMVLVTQNQWYHDDPRISQGVQLCLRNYMSAEAKHCNDLLPAKSVLKVKELLPSGINDSTFWETNFNTTFRAHFIVFWLGLYTAPETKHMAKFWNDFHPRGMWDFRWGDQQWWPRPIAMFGAGNLAKEILHYDEINTDNNKYVVHKEWPRWGTIPQVLYYQFNGTSRSERDGMYRKAAKKFIY